MKTNRINSFFVVVCCILIAPALKESATALGRPLSYLVRYVLVLFECKKTGVHVLPMACSKYRGRIEGQTDRQAGRQKAGSRQTDRKKDCIKKTSINPHLDLVTRFKCASGILYYVPVRVNDSNVLYISVLS